MHNNHCHRVTAHLQLNIYIYIKYCVINFVYSSSQGAKNNTNFKQTAGIQEKMDTTCK